jgi:hypothetical protein
VLDPAPRYLAGDVVIADTLVVGRRAVSGEDPRAARIGTLLAHGGDVSAGLQRLGIGLVVVERGAPGVGRTTVVATLLSVVGGAVVAVVLSIAGVSVLQPSVHPEVSQSQMVQYGDSGHA